MNLAATYVAIPTPSPSFDATRFTCSNNVICGNVLGPVVDASGWIVSQLSDENNDEEPDRGQNKRTTTAPEKEALSFGHHQTLQR